MTALDPAALDPAAILLLVATGLAAGLFGSLLGVGGGLLVIPVLHFVFGLPLLPSIGTSLVSVVLTTLVASHGYLGRGLVDVPAAIHLAFGSLLGAYVASRLAIAVPEPALIGAFTLLVLFAAFRLLTGRGRRRPVAGEEAAAAATETAAEPAAADPTAADPTATAPRGAGPLIAVLLSPLAGALAGLLGIGGGLLQLPLLRLVAGLELRRAVATNALLVSWVASVAAFVYASRGDVVPGLLPALLAGTAVGALAGPPLMVRLPRRRLEIVLGLVLVAVALRMLWR